MFLICRGTQIFLGDPFSCGFQWKDSEIYGYFLLANFLQIHSKQYIITKKITSGEIPHCHNIQWYHPQVRRFPDFNQSSSFLLYMSKDWDDDEDDEDFQKPNWWILDCTNSLALVQDFQFLEDDEDQEISPHDMTRHLWPFWPTKISGVPGSLQQHSKLQKSFEYHLGTGTKQAVWYRTSFNWNYHYHWSFHPSIHCSPSIHIISYHSFHCNPSPSIHFFHLSHLSQKSKNICCRFPKNRSGCIRTTAAEQNISGPTS